MLKQKKTLLFFLFYFVFLLIFFIFILKSADHVLGKKFGLGKPLIYEKSRLTGYNIQPNQKIIRRGNEIIINNLGMRSSKNWENDLKKKNNFFGDSVTYGVHY